MAIFFLGMMAAFIGGSIRGLFFFILFLWCCCSVCCKDHEVNTRNQWEWNKTENLGVTHSRTFKSLKNTDSLNNFNCLVEIL